MRKTLDFIGKIEGCIVFVGYQNRSMMSEGDQLMESYSGGPVFKAVGSTGNTYTLNDFTVNGMSVAEDCIQFLDPDTTETYLSATYADADNYAAGWVGWWDYDDIGATRTDDTDLPAGQGLLGMIASGNEVTLTFDAVLPANE